jgi:hypothetical protein
MSREMGPFEAESNTFELLVPNGFVDVTFLAALLPATWEV